MRLPPYHFYNMCHSSHTGNIRITLCGHGYSSLHVFHAPWIVFGAFRFFLANPSGFQLRVVSTGNAHFSTKDTFMKSGLFSRMSRSVSPKNSIKSATAMAVAAAMFFGSTAVASAQDMNSLLPGASSDGNVVVTDSPRIQIIVGENKGEDTVTVEIKNNYDSNFSCFAPGVSTDAKKPARLPNTVTEAEIVAQAVDYYRTWPNVPSDGINVPLLGVIPTNGLLEFVPDGLLGSALGKQLNTRAQLFRAWEQAKLAGHTGEIPVFELKPFDTSTHEVVLNKPGSGERTDFEAAALVYCTDNDDPHKQQYVFAGYESGKAPRVGGFGGSLGSPGLPSPSLKMS